MKKTTIVAILIAFAVLMLALGAQAQTTTPVYVWAPNTPYRVLFTATDQPDAVFKWACYTATTTPVLVGTPVTLKITDLVKGADLGGGKFDYTTPVLVGLPLGNYACAFAATNGYNTVNNLPDVISDPVVLLVAVISTVPPGKPVNLRIIK